MGGDYMIRDAKPSDLPQILAILEIMHEESINSIFNRDMEKVAHFLKWLMSTDGGIILVDGDPICGVVIGMVQEMWFGYDKEAFNLPLYVLPEHRGGPYAVRLVSGYKRKALELGAHPDAINWINNSGITAEKTNEFIGRMGFSPIGGYFRMLH